MDLPAFKATLSASAPPADLSAALQVLWYEANGDWTRAHEIAQAQDDADGAWVHAYLHRVEGDADNAAYWYRRARHEPSSAPLAQERDEIAAALLRR